MRDTSLSLLARLRDEPAAPDWQRFTEIYDPLMRGWLTRRGVQDQDVDDIVQNILTIVIQRMSGFQHNGRVGAFRTWLRSTTVNCLRDYWRTNRRRLAGAGGSDAQEWIEQLADPDSAMSREWDAEHDRHVMRKLLELLREEFEPRTWLAFQRFALDNVPAAEVAKELGMTPNAVWIARSRVVARLKQECAELLDDEV